MATDVALIAVSLAVAAMIVVPGARARAWLMLASIVVAPALLLAHVAAADQLEGISGRTELLAGAAVVAVGAALLLGWWFSRVPTAFPVAVVVTLPFRIPLSIGGTTASLLLPLYLVVAGGAIAWLLPRLREAGGGEPPREERRPGGLEWALAVVLVLYSVQSIWTSDPDRALENVLFFYVPFAVGFVLLSRFDWTPRLAARLLAVLAALAVVLTAIGFVEFATRHLILNPKVIAANQVNDYFRVNSLFFDPNIFGRFLAIVIVLLVAWICWENRQKAVAAGAVVVAFLFGGLLTTLSQSSYAALLAGLAMLAALRWSVRWTVAVVAVAAVLAAGALAVGAGVLQGGDDASRATSGRSALVAGGVGLFAERPVAGWGSGSFAREYREAENVSAAKAASASHTIPVTVAAEQGVIGLVAYLALLFFAFSRCLRGISSGANPAIRAAVAAAFTALVVHTLAYAAFLEDPVTWVLLAVATAFGTAASGAGGTPRGERPAAEVAAAGSPGSGGEPDGT
ncbi:MAG: O-antigen ligase family protein [Solirubrobacterales bacterium]